MVGVSGVAALGGVRFHRPSAFAAAGDAAGELPQTVIVTGELHVVLDGRAGEVHPLARDAGLGDGDGDPLVLRPLGYGGASLVLLTVRTVDSHLIGLGLAPVETTIFRNASPGPAGAATSADICPFATSSSISSRVCGL